MVMPTHLTTLIWLDGLISCMHHISTAHAGLHCDICDKRIAWGEIFYRVKMGATQYNGLLEHDFCDRCCSAIALYLPLPKEVQPII